MKEILMMFIGFASALLMISKDITEEQFAEVTALCKTNGGLEQYTVGAIGLPTVTCKNGAKFTVGKVNE